MNVIKAKIAIESLPKSAKVVEVAGPTSPYNEFLHDNNIKIAPNIIITNLHKRIEQPYFDGAKMKYRSVTVDEVVNVRSMPYDSSSVDMIVCSYLTWYGDRDKIGKRETMSWFIAKLHYLLKFTKSRNNLHICLFRESYRVLRKGGLLLVEGILPADCAVYKKLGFNIVYLAPFDNDTNISTSTVLLEK